MNLLVEKGVISELELGSNFSYVLNDNSDFLSTEYKVLQSQNNGVFVKCMKFIRNGHIELFYNTNSLKSFSSTLSCIDAEKFLVVVSSILAGIISVKNNGFLSCKNIDSSFEHIFVDQNTFKVSLIYLPIGKHEYDDDSSFENAIRTELVKIITGIQFLSTPRTIQLLADLQNGILTLENIYSSLGGKLVSRNGVEKSVKPEKTNSLSNRRLLRLISMNTSRRVEIIVNKNNYTIGKKDSNDFVVNFNNLISRVHCEIINSNGQYSIVDLKSANGTSVNGAKLVPNRQYTIKNGDIVRLANSNFQVVFN